MTQPAKQRVSATQAKILADLKRFSAGGPVARVYTETVGLREEIADAIRRGVSLDAVVQSVAARCEVDRRSAIDGLRQSLEGLGLDLRLPRGHRAKNDSLRGDLRSAEPAAAPQSDPTPTPGAKKEVEQHPAPTPALVAAPTQPATAPAHAPAKPTPLPDIPNRELTQTEREAIAVPWFAERFGGRNAVHVKVEEVSAAEIGWLERLWDLSAPVNPKTGQAYRIKSFTAVGRPIYDRPSPPPAGTMPVEGGVGDYTHVFVDDDLRSSMAKYGARIARKTGPPGMRIDDDSLQVLFPDGHRSVSFPAYSVNGILRGMMPDIMNNWVKVRNAAPAVVSTG